MSEFTLGARFKPGGQINTNLWLPQNASQENLLKVDWLIIAGGGGGGAPVGGSGRVRRRRRWRWLQSKYWKQ
jgi:hypothetical protein